MTRFLIEVRIHPDALECKNCWGELKATEDEEGYECPDCGRFYEPADVKGTGDMRPEVTAEELASVLANSTASEALADGLGAMIEWEVIETPKVVVHVTGGVCQDVTGLPDGWTYEVHDADEEDHDEKTCPHCGRSDVPFDR